MAVCPYCREPFEPNRKDQIFCCNAHRSEYWRVKEYLPAVEPGRDLLLSILDESDFSELVYRLNNRTLLAILKNFGYTWKIDRWIKHK